MLQLGAEIALERFNSVFGDDIVRAITLADLENYQARRKGYKGAK